MYKTIIASINLLCLAKSFITDWHFSLLNLKYHNLFYLDHISIFIKKMFVNISDLF